MKPGRRKTKILSLVMIYLITAMPVMAGSSDSLDTLKSMSLENLMQVTVFSASKQTEQLSDVAAAMYVINREDILRSGARTLPDLLRGVPGLSVASIDGHSWAISARGFNGFFANKLLVLMDGRTLYTPLYSGVYWDMQDTLLEDIERIEIIRGPGATIWGANAVNGVINIITRQAAETDGVYASAGAGSSDRTAVSTRYGKKGNNLSYRVYAKQLDRDDFESHESGEHPDGWTTEQAGFRADFGAIGRNKISLQGDIYQGNAKQLLATSENFEYETDIDYSGGNLQLQWQKELSDQSSWTVQTYLDRSLREDGFLDQSRTTWDLSATHLFNLLDIHDIVWGAGYRYTADRTSPEVMGGMDPQSASDEVFNLFVQDDWDVLPRKTALYSRIKIRT